MDDAIWFVEGVEVALDFESHNAWSMLLVEVRIVTPRWTCFLGLDPWHEVRVDDEGCPSAIAEVAEGELTPHTRLGHKEDLTAALHSTTIALLQVLHVFALEVTQALLAPVNSVSLCCFDVGHEGGDVCDPRVVSVVVVPICRTDLPLEKINRVGVEFAGDVDRRTCFPLIIQEGEEVDAGLEFVFDGGDLIVADGVVELV